MSIKDTKIPTRSFDISFYNQWGDILLRKCGWYDFTIIDLSVEYAPYKGSVEVEAGLLGLNWILTYTYNKEFTEKMHSLADEMQARFGDVEVLDPNGVLEDIEKDEQT